MQDCVMCIIVQCTVQSLQSILYIKSAAADAISMLDMRPPVLLLLVGSRPTSPALKHWSKIRKLHFNHKYDTHVLDMRPPLVVVVGSRSTCPVLTQASGGQYCNMNVFQARPGQFCLYFGHQCSKRNVHIT